MEALRMRGVSVCKGVSDLGPLGCQEKRQLTLALSVNPCLGASLFSTHLLDIAEVVSFPIRHPEFSWGHCMKFWQRFKNFPNGGLFQINTIPRKRRGYILDKNHPCPPWQLDPVAWRQNL